MGPHVGRVDRCMDCPSSIGRIRETVALFRYDAAPTTRDEPVLAAEPPFAHTLRDAVLRLKHGGASEVGPTLGEALARTVANRGLDGSRLDGVVPVPLHWRRQIGRRYNQAERIAVGVARTLGVPLLPVLRRRSGGRSQQGLTLAERQANVKSAYALASRRVRWWHGVDSLQGARLLLVDDVMTTGSTLVACARVLAEAGAGPIYAAILGRR